VFVPPPPRLSVTRFLAFGDSITQGAVPDGTFPARFRALQLLPSTLTYPGQLEIKLTARYTTQTAQIVVVNRGLQGEPAAAGQARLPRELAASTPDVLLLLEGVNDLNTGNPASSISAAIAALRSMIRQARGNNVRVMIGTLLPERAGGYNAGAINLIVPFNNQLIPMATAEGALVVDAYTEFLPHVSDWIGVDGLHPNVTGYQALGQLFFNAIKGSYEMPGSSTPTRSTPFRTLRR
jgi:lysophospholipase L1-like esterase